MVKTLLRLSWLRGAGGGVLLRLAGGGFTENFVAAVRSIQTGFVASWAAFCRHFLFLGVFLLYPAQKPASGGTPGLEKLPAVLLGKNEAAALSKNVEKKHLTTGGVICRTLLEFLPGLFPRRRPGFPKPIFPPGLPGVPGLVVPG